MEAHGPSVHTVVDDLVKARKSSAADEKDVVGVDLDQLLLRVFAPALGRNGGHCALYDLQEGLLDTFSGDITGDRYIFALFGDLVDLVDIDNADLGFFDIIICRLDKLEENVLNVLTHISRFSERSGIRDRKWHIDDLRESLRQISLSGTGGTQHQDVALLQLHSILIAVFLGSDYTLIMIVHRYGQDLFGLFLPDDILIQKPFDLCRLQKLDTARIKCGK